MPCRLGSGRMNESINQSIVLITFTLFIIISILVYVNTSRVIRHNLPDITHITDDDRSLTVQYDIVFHNIHNDQYKHFNDECALIIQNNDNIQYKYDIYMQDSNDNRHVPVRYNKYNFNVSDTTVPNHLVYYVPTINIYIHNGNGIDNDNDAECVVQDDRTIYLRNGDNIDTRACSTIYNDMYDLLSGHTLYDISHLMKLNHNRLSFTLLNSLNIL